MYGIAKEGTDDILIIQGVFIIFNKLVIGFIIQSNCYLLILNNHGSHVALEAIEQPIEFGWTCVYYLHTLIMPCSPLI